MLVFFLFLLLVQCICNPVIVMLLLIMTEVRESVFLTSHEKMRLEQKRAPDLIYSITSMSETRHVLLMSRFTRVFMRLKCLFRIKNGCHCSHLLLG